MALLSRAQILSCNPPNPVCLALLHPNHHSQSCPPRLLSLAQPSPEIPVCLAILLYFLTLPPVPGESILKCFSFASVSFTFSSNPDIALVCGSLDEFPHSL